MKAIRHQLDVYDTVLRLAYDKPTWKALRHDHQGGPPPGLTKQVPEGKGQVDRSEWQQNPSKHAARRNVLHLAIWIDVEAHGPDLAELVATVAHESVHAAGDILAFIHERRTPAEAGEQFAYLVDWLVRWVWDNLP